MANGDERQPGDGARPVTRIGAAREPEEGDRIEVDVSPTELLAAIARLDVEAALAYETAAALSGDAELARQLGGFAEDHRRHVDGLNAVLAREGESLVDAPAGAMSVLAGLVQLAAPLGEEVVVVALLANEQLTNLSYDGALAYEWAEEDEELLQRFAQDEQRHLAWLAARHDALPGHARPAEEPGPLE